MTRPALRRAIRALPAVFLALALAAPAVRAQVRVADLTLRAGDVPRRLAGYGLVTGLDGTGDRSLGGHSSGTPTVRSVVNLLRRFGIEVPPDQLRLRNVAAVAVTAEVSPYLRAGGRFEVQVSALGDAISLRGGVLWVTPLVTDPNQPAVATAQGPLYIVSSDGSRSLDRRVNSARIPTGGVLEVEAPAVPLQPRLLLRQPDLATAGRIATAVNLAFGAGTAAVDDPGAVTLAPPQAKDAPTDKDKVAENSLGTFLAAVDTLRVNAHETARIVIDGREGTVVAGGEVRIRPAVVSHHGITLEIAPSALDPAGAAEGLVRLAPGSPVQSVAAGLHAAGARPDEVAAIFTALEAAGALDAEVVIR
jgi:flagellar P-ring protein FlgI